jgi:hypothetical protein
VHPRADQCDRIAIDDPAEYTQLDALTRDIVVVENYR